MKQDSPEVPRISAGGRSRLGAAGWNRVGGRRLELQSSSAWRRLREAILMKVAVVGAGYVGLTTSACLAALGHAVVGADVDAERVRELQRARVPIYEPGLADLVRDQLAAGRLTFTADPVEAVADAAVVLLAVGTPSDLEGDIDLSFVERAARELAPHLRTGAVLVVKSTVVPGTAHRLQAMVDTARRCADVSVASNPEFLREGTAIVDFLHADRVVLGVEDLRAESVLRRLYAPLDDVPVVATSTVNAELTKYAANAFLALKIGFINEVADLCESLGGDVRAVARAIGLDSRIGPAFLDPGPGFGGSCFPKDTRAFASTGRRAGTPQTLIETLIERNAARRQQLADRILRYVPAGSRVAVLGTAFKADTDDVREAASLTIVPALVEAGLIVDVHDPQPSAAKAMLQGISWRDTPYDAVAGAHAVVILTEWAEYRRLDVRRLARLMAGDLVIDYRNVLDGAEVIRHGLRYCSLGRPTLVPSEHAGHATNLGSAIGVAASPP